MEQIRIVKEMRDADRLRGRTGQFIRPRYMVWENVPGAFSSNKGADFKAVLEETIRIAAPEAPDIPLPPKGGWPLADAYYGDGWSVAYRVLDAQFWGVPQRRRRIALVADFGGQSAPEILFERESLSWDTPEGGNQGETAAGGAGQGAGDAVTMRIRCGCAGGGKGALIQNEKSGTLGCNNDQILFCLNDQGGQIMDVTVDKTGTLRAQEHGHQPIVFDTCGNGNGETVLVMATGQANAEILQDKSPTLISGNERPIVTVSPNVRRLTPMEEERLQGFPDGWTDIGDWKDEKGKIHKTSDAARYKALGNSIALPPWKWVLKRLCAMYERDATLGSLFDGIGGFPRIWEQLNGEGSCLWASEIEPFCIAVTKKRFGNS